MYRDDDAPVCMRQTLHLTVGLPGAGKTTLACRIADECPALRLTPDEWMAPLFGESDAQGRRDIVEGRMISVAHQVLHSGSSVILDFGCWSPEERYAIRAIAESAGAEFALHYVEIDERERRARAQGRWRSAPGSTFPMSDIDHDRFRVLFQPPSPAELAYGPIPEPPSGFDSWRTGRVTGGPRSRIWTRPPLAESPPTTRRTSALAAPSCSCHASSGDRESDRRVVGRVSVRPSRVVPRSGRLRWRDGWAVLRWRRESDVVRPARVAGARR